MTIPAFPSLPGLVYPRPRSAMWQTDVQTSVTGKVTALARQSFPRYTYELGFSYLRADNVNLELQTLLAFYNSVNGRFSTFHFTDPDDNAVANQLFDDGDGTTASFQLVRAMTGIGVSFVEPVSYPTAAQIYNNGVLQTQGVDYTLSATGSVTFTVPPAGGNPLTWTGTYDWLCRFNEDSATFEKFTYLLYALKKITFTTEKV